MTEILQIPRPQLGPTSNPLLPQSSHAKPVTKLSDHSTTTEKSIKKPIFPFYPHSEEE